MRSRTLEMDGASLTYSPLTLEQTEEMQRRFGDVQAERSESEKVQKSNRAMREVAALGLNNALTNGEPRWDDERVRRELDPVLWEALWKAILEMSGIRMSAEAGEAKAPA